MKNFKLLLIMLLGFAISATAQVKIGDNPTTIDASAVLELESTTQGFLAPRMTMAQMNAIPSPATGLHVFCLGENRPCWQVNTPANPYWNCDGSIVLKDPSDLPASNLPIGGSVTIIDETDGSVLCTGTVPSSGTVTACGDLGDGSGGGLPTVTIVDPTDLPATGLTPGTPIVIVNTNGDTLCTGTAPVSGNVSGCADITNNPTILVDPTDLPYADGSIGDSVVIVDDADGTILCSGYIYASPVTGCGDIGGTEPITLVDPTDLPATGLTPGVPVCIENTSGDELCCGTVPASGNVSGCADITSNPVVLVNPTDLPYSGGTIGDSVVIVDNTGTVECSGYIDASPVTGCGDVVASLCPTAGGNVAINGAPSGATCGASTIALSSSYTSADSYAWTANNGATFDDATSATPNLTLPDANVNVTVNLTVTKAGCTPSSVSATAVTIDVDPAPSVSVAGPNCLDVEQTDYDPVGDPLADRTANPDDFTNLTYTVGTSTGGTGFTWTWVSNPGNHGTINSGASTHTADITFAKTLAAAGGTGGGAQTYVLQCEITGLTCGTMTRTITVTVQDKSCFCATAVVEVTSATGEVWMDRNLGATQQATSSTDHLAYGCHFQWGRDNDGHADIDWTSSTAGTYVNGTTSTNATSDNPGHSDFITEGSSPYDWRTPQNNSLWQGVSGINNPCPAGYRLPTEAEWTAEDAIFPTQNSSGAYNSVLKLPVAGARSSSNGLLSSAGSSGHYWSSTVSGTSARRLLFHSSNSYMNSYYRAFGFSVRCIKD